MPRFPNGFTTLPRAVTGDDYLMVDAYRATVDTLGQFLGGRPLVEWNGTSASQFDAAQTWGSPVGNSLTYVSSSTAASGVLRLKLGAGSPALSGAVYWFTDEVDFQSMRLQYAVSVNAVDPLQAADDIYVGVVIAGDATEGSCIAHTLALDGGGTSSLLITGNDGYGANAFTDTQAITNVTFSIVNWTFNGQLVNVAGFPTAGVPALAGTTDIIATGASARQSFIDTITSASGWDVSVGGFSSNRVGLVVGTVGGCAAAASLDISLLSFMPNVVAYP